MKKVVLVAVLALCSLSMQAQAKQWTTIRIGLEAAYAPFSSKNPDGSLTGFEVDLATALCAQMKATCTFVEQDWDGIIPALNARKFDAIISSMSITAARRRQVEFSDKYYHTPSRLIARVDGRFAGTPESTRGKKIGVLRASTQEMYANDVYGKAGATVIAYASQNEAFLDLASGRLDATLIDTANANESFLKTSFGKGFGFVGPEVDDPAYFGLGVGVALRRPDTDLRDQFNAAIKAIRANGVYKKVQDKYFDFDVYGR